MGAKAAGDGTKETGAGKLILFIEVGSIGVEKKRGLGKTKRQKNLPNDGNVFGKSCRGKPGGGIFRAGKVGFRRREARQAADRRTTNP